MSACSTNSNSATPDLRGNWFTRAVDWMDVNGPGAWIALMVAGFIFVWPLGLVLLFFILFTGRFGGRWREERRAMRRGFSCGRGMNIHASRATGNAAFDTYKADTLERLEREQQDFEEFLHRLRKSRDKAEFDQYMNERAKAAEAVDTIGQDTRDTRSA